MLKKTVTYTDYNGLERTEDFYFNLNDAEIMEMQVSTTGGLAEKIRKIVDSKDGGAIIATFKEIVLKAYGVKSDDGRLFIKNDKVRDEFVQTEAYSKVFMELALDADAAAKFVNGIVPNNIKPDKANSEKLLDTTN